VENPVQPRFPPDAKATAAPSVDSTFAAALAVAVAETPSLETVMRTMAANHRRHAGGPMFPCPLPFRGRMAAI
jgi:hypothetical protein